MSGRARVGELRSRQDLLEAASALASGSARSLLGITGPPGSGKTTLAAHLAQSLPGVAHVPMDGFHLADVALDRLGRREAKGAPDTFDGWGYLALLRRLREPCEQDVYAPMFERELEQPLAGAIAVPPAARLVVSEGNYLLLPDQPWPQAAACFDQIWYCQVDAAELRRRLVARHEQFGKESSSARAWVDQVDMANAARVEAYRSRADVVVSVQAVAELAG